MYLIKIIVLIVEVKEYIFLGWAVSFIYKGCVAITCDFVHRVPYLYIQLKREVKGNDG